MVIGQFSGLFWKAHTNYSILCITKQMHADLATVLRYSLLTHTTQYYYDSVSRHVSSGNPVIDVWQRCLESPSAACALRR